MSGFSFDRCSCGRLNIHGATCVCESEPRHDGAVGDARKRDAAPAPVPDDTYRVYKKSDWQALAAEICDRLGERPSERHGEIAETVLCSDWLAAHDHALVVAETAERGRNVDDTQSAPDDEAEKLARLIYDSERGHAADSWETETSINRGRCEGYAEAVLASGYVPPDAHAAAVAEAERTTAERIARAILDRRVVCPNHHMPDCSPLLNGCSVPNWLHDEREHAARIAREAVGE